MTRRRLRSEIAWSSPDRIVVRGLNLADDLIGKVSLGDMAFLELVGRLPTPQESAVFNAMTVTLVEHGLTPSTLAARLTYFGSPEALQAAVAAGLLGMGDRFGGSTEDAARMLQEALANAGPGADLSAIARDIVAEHKAAGRPVAGLGHPIHKPVDPRTPRLFAVARDNGFSGRYVQLIERVSEEATAAYGRPLPVNATGAIGALASELNIHWKICRGIAVMARAIGLVAHLKEEIADPIAGELWSRAESEATEQNRPGTE